MGVAAEKISLVPYAIDNARFLRDAHLSPQQRAAARRRYGLSPERPVVLYVSKLQRRKHPDDLLRAARKLAAEGLDFDLAIAGAGEMEDELKAMAADVGRQCRVSGLRQSERDAAAARRRRYLRAAGRERALGARRQ